MKDKFIYKDGLIYTNDKKNKKVEEFKIYKYQDNINDILATENLLEDLENNKKSILKNNQKLLNKYLKLKDILIGVGALCIIGVLFVICVLSALSLAFPVYMLTSFGICVLYAGALVFAEKILDKNYNKKKNYNFGKLDKVNEEININLKKLLELENDNKKDLEENYKNNGVVNVSYKEKLLELRELIKLYGKIASNKEKYEKYYYKGTLDKKLESKYNEEERKLIKKYFSDNKN